MMTLPDLMVRDIYMLEPKQFLDQGVRMLVLDVDNTLAPYELSEPDERILAWLSALSKNGIGFAFISNNSSDKRIKRFNEKIGAPAFARAGKPFAKKTIRRALSALGASKENAAFMGDQLFTDVCAGRFYGMRTILVPPIKDKKNLFFKFKRALEKPVLKGYFRKNESS